MYEDVADDRWYRLVVPSYMASSGDGYHTFKNNSRNHKVGTLDMDHLEKYVTRMSPIIAGNDRRIVFLEP